jgi:hypothetical protein
MQIDPDLNRVPPCSIFKEFDVANAFLLFLREISDVVLIIRCNRLVGIELGQAGNAPTLQRIPSYGSASGGNY